MAVTVETFASVSEAARALSADRQATYLGGGTLVMRDVNYGQAPLRIVRATDPALREVRSSGQRIEIGAGLTMAEIAEHRDLGALAPAARAVGGPAIRNMATLGGNLFAAHPYGDLATMLLALDGIARLADGRELPLAELFAARERGPRPIVQAVSVMRADPAETRFHKVSRVKPKGVAVLSIGAWLPLSGGRIARARVAYGAMGPAPLRAVPVERALEGRRLDADGAAPALAAAGEGTVPPTDALATGWYRARVLPVHLRRCLLGA